MRLDVASLSLRGEREINEDCINHFWCGELFCALLCDGLGGHDSGELASAFVCGDIEKTLRENENMELNELACLAIEKASRVICPVWFLPITLSTSSEKVWGFILILPTL